MSIQRALLVLAALAFASTHAMAAQTVTGFKTGEVTTGMTKQCFYNVVGNTYTHTISATEICPLNIQVRPTYAPAPASPTPTSPYLRTLTAFKTGELTTGMTKQCFYNALGNGYTYTMHATEICPLHIQVPPR